jgi:ArsR family transcriptional regulator
MPRTPSNVAGASLTSPEHAEICAEILRAVAHPLRLRIVAILCGGEQHVNGLAELLGARQAFVSQQLKILRMANLVAVVRRQGHSMYSLAEPHVEELVGCMGRCVAERCADGTVGRRRRG